MNSWSGCECSAGGLSYSDDQINQFNSNMNSKGNTLIWTWWNQNVWGSDIGEDRDIGGVMGYRGTSADSFTTAEVLGDWVNDAFASTVYIFKISWFSAIEDWWVDDTGAVISGGWNKTDSEWRRDNYARTTPRRAAWDYWTWYSWAWHQG